MEESFDQLLQNYASNNNNNNNNSTVKSDQSSINNTNTCSEYFSTVSSVTEVSTVETYCGETSKTEPFQQNNSDELNILSNVSESLKPGIPGVANLKISTADCRHVKGFSDTHDSSPEETEVVRSVTISEHDNWESISIPDNDVISSRICELINEAIHDNNT